MRVIVAGDRRLRDFRLVRKKLDRILAKVDKKRLVIISGHEDGADRLGEQWANENMVRYEIHRAEWTKHGKRADRIKIDLMVSEADALIWFSSSNSDESEYLLSMAKSSKLTIRIVKRASI